MKAIILAAGIGSRLGEIGIETPKCLLVFGNKTLLEKQIDTLNACGIKSEDIIIVIGGSGEAWSKENQDRVRKILSNVIINEENINKNQAYSFWLAVKEVNDDILCIDGDMLLNKEIINRVVESKYPSIILSRVGDNISEGRRGVEVKNERVLGIGKHICSNKIYIPILKLNAEFLLELKKEMKTDLYFQDSIDVPINKICTKATLYNLNFTTKELTYKFLTLNVNTQEEWQRAQKLFK